MLYFKHMSNMRHNVKVRRLISRYGVEGYGLYCIIVESITEKLTTESPVPDLQETCEDMADFYGGNTAKINEMVSFMVNQGLLEVDNLSARVTCNKIYKFLEANQTRSDKIRELIKNYKSSDGYHSDGTELLSQTVRDKSERTEQNRTEEEQEEEEEPGRSGDPHRVPSPSEASSFQKKTIDPESVEYRLAKLLYTEHLRHDERFLAGKDIVKILSNWSVDIEKLIRLDMRAPEEVARVIQWAQAPGCFWIPNILSGKTLRDKFPTLVAQAFRTAPPKAQTSKSSSFEEQWKRDNGTAFDRATSGKPGPVEPLPPLEDEGLF